jgi:lambda family phage portal protein
MNMFERAIVAVAPRWAEGRARSRAVVAHYDAATVGRRSSSIRADRSDADAAGRKRALMAAYSRDMVRNTPFATRAQAVIAGNVVGDGILPKVQIKAGSGLNDDVKKRIRARGLERIESLFDTVEIDRQKRNNLYGLQRLVMNTVVDAGECLVRFYPGSDARGSLPLELDVLEPDYLDTSKLSFASDGFEIREGIEYDAEKRRVAYWLFPEHPGGDWSPGTRRGISERVPAEEVLHIYRTDRPGQQRGVTWFAPVMLRLQDLDDHEDAQLMRQKIAACFAAFRVLGDGGSASAQARPAPDTIMPGMIYDLTDGEDVKFAAPPGVEGYDEFTRSVLRSVAAGMGLSYEALSGDLAQVNFSSARMGRIEMDANVSVWQWLMLIPQLMHPIGKRFIEAWASVDAAEMAAAGIPDDIWDDLSISWVPPRRVIVDPAREFTALKEAVRAGFASRQQVVRQLGIDPERLMEEIAQDRADANVLDLIFDSDPRSDLGRAVETKSKETKTDE